MSERAPSIAIIGAGIIGLSCAWEMAKRGAKVTIYDRGQPGMGASYAAAGMLAAGYECALDSGGHSQLAALRFAGGSVWDDFAASLEHASGYEIGFEQKLSFVVGTSLDAVTKRLNDHQVYFDLVDLNANSNIEPSLSPDLRDALVIHGDAQVDNRAVIKALLAVCHKAGVKISNNTDGASVEASEYDQTLWCVGAAPEMEEVGVTPVKGAAFSLRPGSYLPKHVIHFGSNYIVPKHDRVIIGATMEPGMRDDQPDPQLVGELRQRAARICPGVEAASVISVWSGLRPTTQDHAPIMGQLSDGRWIATGHYRNGILLAPITAKIMADMILNNKVSELAATFSPNRFVSAAT